MLSERALIETILAPLARSDDGSLGLTDDAAFIACRGDADLVVTQDTLIGDIHFRACDPPDLIARKALRVNLSDLAAKGGDPYAYFLSLGLPANADRQFAEAFAAGLLEDQRTFGIALYGGDTVRSPDRLVITITVCGFVPAGTMVRRSNARPGDLIYVSGTIGDSAIGLAALQGGVTAVDDLAPQDRDVLTGRFLLPQPRTTLAAVLRKYAHAAMDVSDGLAGDLALLTSASGVSAEVEVDNVPYSGAVRRVIAAMPDLRERALTGGDDYEILCTLEADAGPEFEAAAAEVGVVVTRIGRIVEGTGRPEFLDRNGNVLRFARPSYAHF